MRALLLGIVTLVALATTRPAQAAANIGVSINPTSGPASGNGVSSTFSATLINPSLCGGAVWYVRFDSPTNPVSSSSSNTTMTVTVPVGEPQGTRTLYVSCSPPGANYTAVSRFTVTPPPTVSVSPNQGSVGSAFTITGTGYRCPAGSTFTFIWDPGRTPTQLGSGSYPSGTAVVPGGAAGSLGTHTVQGICIAPNGDFEGPTTTYTVIPVTTTTAPPTTPPPTTAPTTAPPTTAKGTTTTAPGDTTSTTDTTTTTDTTLPGETTTTTDPAHNIQLDHAAISPGGDLLATGVGCQPDANVQFLVHGSAAGQAVADATGRFKASLALPDLPVGRYLVVASCGATLSAPLDVVLATTSDPATSTLCVLLFFVLIGLALLRRQLIGDAGLDRRPPHEP